jgi:hypothetical protein
MTELHAMQHWAPERIARLGFLMGLGWHGDRIANDPVIATTSNNVFRQAHRWGLSFRAVQASRTADAFHAAAAKRGITDEELVSKLLQEIGADPVLIDNILDDESEGATA